MEAAESQQTTEQDTAAQDSRPAKAFSASGGLNVAIWKHRNEDGPDRYSVKLDRTYRDESGEYHSTPYLRDGDLLRAAKTLEAADQWIEQDKAKFKAARREDAQAR